METVTLQTGATTQQAGLPMKRPAAHARPGGPKQPRTSQSLKHDKTWARRAILDAQARCEFLKGRHERLLQAAGKNGACRTCGAPAAEWATALVPAIQKAEDFVKGLRAFYAALLHPRNGRAVQETLSEFISMLVNAATDEERKVLHNVAARIRLPTARPTPANSEPA